MTPTLRIQLLGQFHLLLDEEPLAALSPRLQALLAYLLLHRHAPQARRQVAFHFWPDSTEEQAHTNLRKLFFQLRQSLPKTEEYLVSDSQSVGWRKEATYRFDVAEMEQGLAEVETSETPAVATVERVVRLYTGELLPTCYEEWLLPLRQALHERVAQGHYEAGLRCAEHLRRLDPLHETTYRHLMRLRAANGDRAGALRVYHEWLTMLEQELGVSPATETQALYQQLLRAEPRAAPAEVAASVQRRERIPLVGRGQEWQLLQRAWQQVAQRGPQMIAIWGEAGIGKTRLVEELLHWARLRPGTAAYARSYAAEGAMSYAPLTDWLRSEPLHPALAKLEPLWLSETARLLPELLSEKPELPPPAAITEGWQRRRFHEALVRSILASPSPWLLALDDLQWCDGETLAWLRYLLRFDAQAPLLVVGTVRSEAVDEQHPLHELRRALQHDGQWTELTLTPLSGDETALLAGHLTNADMTGWRERLYHETEGNPLFVVEMVRAGFVIGQEGQSATLPPLVQSVIAARLAQLSPAARHLTQLAATIGRAFTHEVLAAANGADDDPLLQGIDELWRKGLIREQGVSYDFSHDKIREVAYTAIGPLQQRILHRRVAQALEALYPGEHSEISGQIAVHFERAGLFERAVHHYLQAAETAIERYANREALQLFQQALPLIPALPKAEQIRQELRLQRGQASILGYSRGRVPELERALLRALELSEQCGDMTFRPELLQGLIYYYYGRAEFQKAIEISDRALVIAEHEQNALMLLDASVGKGASLFHMGHFEKSLKQFERGIDAADQARGRLPVAEFGFSYRAVAEPRRAWGWWFLGYSDQASTIAESGMSLAKEMGYPPRIAFCLFGLTRLYLYQREIELVYEKSQEVIDFATKYGFPQRITHGAFLRGWARAAKGEEEGITQMEEGLAGWLKTGTQKHQPDMLVTIAEAGLRYGQIERGLARLAQAQELMDQRQEYLFQAELYRVRGELLSMEGSESAEEYLQNALQIARQQQAKALELRAAISLSRLWQQQGKQEEAYNLLSGIYQWFSEGFDTPDLLEAKALLEQLS